MNLPLLVLFFLLGNHVPRYEKLQRRRTGWKGLGVGGASAEKRSHPERRINVNFTCRRWQQCRPPPLHLLVMVQIKTRNLANPTSTMAFRAGACELKGSLVGADYFPASAGFKETRVSPHSLSIDPQSGAFVLDSY